MRNDDQWLKQIKDNVESYEEPAPSFVWDNISDSLANTKSHASKKIIPFYRKSSIWAAAATLLIGFISYLVIGEKEKIEVHKIYVAEDNYATDMINKVQTNKESANSYDATKTFRADHNSRAEQTPQTKLMATHTEVQNRKAQPVTARYQNNKSAENQERLQNIDIIENAVEEDVFEEPQPLNKEKTNVSTEKRVYDDLYAHLKNEHQPKSIDNTSAMGFHIGGGGALFNQANGAELQTTMREVSSDYFTSPQTILLQKDQQITMRQGVPYIVDQVKTKDYKHRQPISFGLNYSYRLNQNIALESGLVYTFLSSDVTEVAGGKSYKQKFNYLGVPVKVNWSFFNHNRLSLYAAAGGMVEIAVAGKINGKSERPTRPQFSTQAGVGLMYKIANHVGLYIEPGASYFFNDGGHYETIRTEKPFNFNLNTGVRLTF